MATLILVRHGRTSANASGRLAGRTEGVRLDELGEAQTERAGKRLASAPLAALVSSPLERCQQTAAAIRDAHPSGLDIETDDGLTECDYGEWQGKTLKTLSRKALWKTVQNQPSAVVFPGGESMTAMAARAVGAARRHDAAVEEKHGSDAIWAAVSHGDLIKAILADALGMHLDLFQRITVDPASISVIRYTEQRPFVVVTNSHDGELTVLGTKKDTKSDQGDAALGGGAGPDGSGD